MFRSLIPPCRSITPATLTAALLAAISVLSPSISSAQAITSYGLGIYNVANPAAPVSTWTAPVAAWECNLPQPPDPPAVVTNPEYLYRDDVSNAGRACRVPLNAPGSPILALPWSGTMTYDIRATATNEAGVISAPGTTLNRFTKPGAPLASPARLRLTSGS